MGAEAGIHTKDNKLLVGAVRDIIPPGDGGYDAKHVLELFKGQKVPMVIEQFRDGATVRGFLQPSFHWVTVFLSGVSCPGFKRSEVPGAPDVADAFAQEAKYFVESRLLNRDVEVVLEGVDKYNNFYGTILHPAGNISEELLKVGLGKVIDWSAKFAKDAELLYKAERMAKEKRLRIWKDYSAPQRSATATGNSAEFVGKVVEIISGDFLVVKVPPSTPLFVSPFPLPHRPLSCSLPLVLPIFSPWLGSGHVGRGRRAARCDAAIARHGALGRGGWVCWEARSGGAGR